TLDPNGNIGSLRAEPARQCIRPDSGFQFRYAPEVVRPDSYRDLGEESIAIAASASIPEALIVVDVRHCSVEVELSNDMAIPMALISPEDAGLPPTIPPVEREAGRVRFSDADLKPGVYLLSLHRLSQSRASAGAPPDTPVVTSE